jgi:hypothetical protein
MKTMQDMKEEFNKDIEILKNQIEILVWKVHKSNKMLS